LTRCAVALEWIRCGQTGYYLRNFTPLRVTRRPITSRLGDPHSIEFSTIDPVIFPTKANREANDHRR